MGTSRIEQSIEDIYEYVESCKPQRLSPSKVVISKDELYDLLDELRMRAPDEIKRYKKVIANREAILEEARVTADQIIAEAKQKTETLVNESEVVQQAYFQANQIVTQASEEANRIMTKATQESDQIRISALSYTNDLLADAENALANAYQGAVQNYESLISTLKYALDTVRSNRAELGFDNMQPEASEEAGTEGSVYAEQMPENTTGDQPSDDDFNFDENTFLEDIH